MRVRRHVVDDEAGIDRDRSMGGIDGDRLDVPAWSRVLFEQADLMLLPQGVGGAQAADPGPDHGDLHPSLVPAGDRALMARPSRPTQVAADREALD
jgi:hypothetical protein